MRKIFVCASDLIKIFQFSSKVGLIKIQNYHLSGTGPCPAIRRPKSATSILGRIPHPRFQKKMTMFFADFLIRSQISRRRGSRFISQSSLASFRVLIKVSRSISFSFLFQNRQYFVGNFS